MEVRVIQKLEITYDPDKISYEDLVEIYWRQTDPTDAAGQFADRGEGYRPSFIIVTKKNDKLPSNPKKI